jgi:hypothetical protein
MGQWLVIISRDQPEQWVTWTCFYGGAGRVEVAFDRRQVPPRTGPGDHPDRRARPTRETALQEHGFLVIPRPELAGAAR